MTSPNFRLWFATSPSPSRTTSGDESIFSVLPGVPLATGVRAVTPDDVAHPEDLVTYIIGMLRGLTSILEFEHAKLSDEFLRDVVNADRPGSAVYAEYDACAEMVFGAINGSPTLVREWVFGRQSYFVSIYDNHWVSALYPSRNRAKFRVLRTVPTQDRLP